ncbi:MAG: SRPBCC family protein [Candidatus Polarisedimenticolia bacterium]
MSGKGMEGRGRVVKAVIEIEAPREAVWAALTDPVELVRWFPLEAKVTPGNGGSIWYAWGSWWQGGTRIDHWEPPTRLRTVPEEPLPDGRVTLAFDVELEARGGRTVLRLVHAGFGEGAGWDHEYDGVRRGWGFELRGLRHYLERHRGSDRTVAWAHHPIGMKEGEAWARLMAPGGLFLEGLPAGLAEGRTYGLTLHQGMRLEGEIQMVEPPAQLVMTAANLNHALMRVELEHCGGTPQVVLWASTYGVPPEAVRRLESEMEGAARRLFPA